MANLSKTRTLFAWTSPRTIEKIIPEIALLIHLYEGKVWSGNSALQANFFKALAKSDFFEGQKEVTFPDFAGRDRITRAPQMLGFVDLKPTIELTAVGKQLLSGKRVNEVIARQLFKFQFPSPYHHNFPKDAQFNVKPYLELLRLVKELGNISKTEVAIFFLPMIHHNKFTSVVKAIKQFRLAKSKFKGNRKVFTDAVFTKEIKKIYSKEIKAKSLKKREGGDGSLATFIKAKKNNHRDYADAFIRYLRATQFISFEKKTFRMIVAPSRIAEVEYVLKTVDRNAKAFEIDEYKTYLFNPDSLLLLTDDRNYIETQLERLAVKFAATASIESLKDLLEATEKKIIATVIEETEVALKNYKAFDDIIDVFVKIQNKDVPDPSLYLEWNIWRAMVMINYAKHVKPNFTLDLDGVPLNTALGNVPDIEIDYDGFKLIVEVTMSTGQKQYEMEHESVARHYGRLKNATEQPVYCLFVAPKISDATLAYFYDKNIKAPKFYGGQTKIIPLNLSQFITFITIARAKGFNNSKVLKSYMDFIIQKNLSLDDENIWYQQIHESVGEWVN